MRRALNAWFKRVVLARIALSESEVERIAGLTDLTETNAVLAERVEQWARKCKQEGQAQLLAGQLEQRFGPLPPEIAQRVAGANEAQLATWSKAVLTAPTLDAVFTDASH